MAAENQPVILTFGGGINAKARQMDVNINECTDGDNFDLNPSYQALTRRRAFDLSATVPNTSQINGYAQLIARDGSVSTLIQAGTNVYEWDHSSTFTLRGSVAANTKMRGPRDQNWTLDEYVIITDLNKNEIVKKWDGTAFSTHTTSLVGSFYAKYCRVVRERAWFGNVKTGSTDLPHLVVGSELSNAEVLSTSDRPASTLGYDSAFYIPMPDLKPINGMEAAFGTFLFSTSKGRLYQLSGSSAFDFEINEFYPGSAASGDEAIANIGNDVLFGLPGRIETLSGTLNYGDVESDDLSLWISPRIEDVPEWTIIYDRRLQKAFCFPSNQSAVWVMHKNMLQRSHVAGGNVNNAGLSPWAKWTTGHTMAFSPTCVMPLIDGSSGLEVVYAGDSLGNIYKLDGDAGIDAGTTSLTVTRTSGYLSIPEGSVFDVEGWVHYRKDFSATLTLTFLHAGKSIFDQDIIIPLTAGDGIAVYNGSDYYNLSSYYGRSFSGRISRRDFTSAGQSSGFQVKVTVESDGDVQIDEIGLRFKKARLP